MFKTTISVTVAISALMLLSSSSRVLAQDQLVQSSDAAEALAALPDELEQQVVDALNSADYAVISAVIADVVDDNPEMAIEIVAAAARAMPDAASEIVSAAIKAIMARDPAATGQVIEMSRAVAEVAPAYVAQIAVAVMQALPSSLQNNATRNLIMTTVSDAANPPNPGVTMAEISRALDAAKPSAPTALTTPIIPQSPVSGT